MFLSTIQFYDQVSDQKSMFVSYNTLQYLISIVNKNKTSTSFKNRTVSVNSFGNH